MDLRIEDLSELALKGIGRMLTPERWLLPGPGEDYVYADTQGDLGLEPPLSSGVLDCAPRPKEVRRMERHLRTREILVAPCGDLHWLHERESVIEVHHLAHGLIVVHVDEHQLRGRASNHKAIRERRSHQTRSHQPNFPCCPSAARHFSFRLIKPAANPAPKPLSMFTTVTPAAHEFSIPRSAARPLKLAP